jgi:riboflavin kinase/FMN adenylyltransferase
LTGVHPPAGIAVSVGVFDGVHLGHAKILATALARARGIPASEGHVRSGQGPGSVRPEGRCVVVSFDPHPDLVLSRSFRALAPLTPLPERRERIAALGIRELEVIPFTRELASLEPEAFVERYLVRSYHLHSLVVGEGFALGRGRSGNVERLAMIGERQGFTVVVVPLLQLDGGPVSSTRVRTLLEAGRVAPAARLLGRCYDLAGQVVGGEGVGRALGFPTANLRLREEKLVPGDGVYAAWVRIDGGKRRLPAAMSIGVRPTFDGQARALEVHLLDWEGDLLGRDLEVELVDWIRPQERFADRAELAAAMERDVAEVRQRLAQAPAGSLPGLAGPRTGSPA